MELIHYDDLTARYGRRMAYAALLIIEGSAKVRQSDVVPFDCEKRLRSALDAMREQELAA
jgi:hypothetical protein